MKSQKIIGVLAFHGDVIEHITATKNASKNLHLNIEVVPVRTKEIIYTLDALIIPGGESTTLHKLCEREGMWEKMKQIKNIFGTCAGAIMLAKQVSHKTHDQKTLKLMDIEIDRNAYGRQTESFEKDIKTSLGNIHAVFIRAPRITSVGKEIKILAKNNDEIVACEQKIGKNYYLAACFHPELTSTIFHEYFIKKVYTKI
ncbi:MAG: pyridoxal 5'-phosphate synthase glutaminase subunit PdxT [Patescibacteria group bacterium]